MYQTNILKHLNKNGDLFWGRYSHGGGWFATYDSGKTLFGTENAVSKDDALNKLVDVIEDELFCKCKELEKRNEIV